MTADPDGAETQAALAHARRIVPGLLADQLFRVTDAFGTYWQMNVPGVGLYNFASPRESAPTGADTANGTIRSR